MSQNHKTVSSFRYLIDSKGDPGSLGQMRKGRALTNNIPISITEDDHFGSFLDADIARKRKKHASWMKERLVGPVPARAFVTTFLPRASEIESELLMACDALKKVFLEETDFSRKNMSKALCECVSLLGGSPRFELSEISQIRDPSIPTRSIYPEICLFDKVLLNSLSQASDTTSILGSAEFFVQIKTDAEKEDPFQDADLNMEMPGFCFIKDFQQDDEDGEESGEDAEEEKEDLITQSLGDIAVFAAELCARQFRTHCFSISIYETKARLFRWDRAGVITSESFDIRENPEILCLFIQRYSQASDAVRGHDISVTNASREEEDTFAKVIRGHVKEQLSAKEIELDDLVKEHYKPNSVFKLSIQPRQQRERTSINLSRDVVLHDGDEVISRPYPWDELWHDMEEVEESGLTGRASLEISDKDHKIYACSPCTSKSRKYTSIQYFLVSRPVVTPSKFACRGTRGYWAVKLPDSSIKESEYSIAFVKDTWRDDSEFADIEGDVIIENVEAGVKFVSDLFCHGDVMTTGVTEYDEAGAENNHVAHTKIYAGEKWNCNKNKRTIPSLVHYRMASTEVGYPLSTFRGTKELIHGVRCGFLAAWSAYILCGRLHRDISINNFVLVKKGGRWRVGVLIDWELSSRTGKDGKALDSSRCGTWAFMSIASLGDEEFYHRFRDDMESTYYVILYASVSWLPHNDLDAIEKRISRFFDDYEIYSGVIQGGCMKFANIGLGSFQRIWKFSNTSVQTCLDKLIQLQRPLGKQPDWTPQNLYAILKSTDEEDLPEDDRIDNVGIQNADVARRRALADLRYAESTTYKKTSSCDSEEYLHNPETKSLTSSKRSADDAGLEDRVESKRCCHVSVLEQCQEEGQSCQRF